MNCKPKVDLTGHRFGRLLVISYAGGGRWRCSCDCGGESVSTSNHLTSGNSQSCGCSQFKHRHAGFVGDGKRRSPTYNSWRNMKARCKPGNKGHDHHRYPEKGITVCEQWQSFENFLADMGERPEGKTLDRIENSRGYEPGNCRWATPKEQALNTSKVVWLEIDGVRKCMNDWARHSGLSCTTIKERMAAGWSAKQAVEEPRTENRGPTSRRRSELNSVALRLVVGTAPTELGRPL